ncbi:MAG: DUF2284 domain-containing protein [Methanobacteriota archaeon]
MKSERIVAQLIKSAREKGANSAKLISARGIFVEEYVRLKCKYGCKEYAKRFTCPPYTPTINETKELLKSYHRALLVEFIRLKIVEKQKNIRKIMYDLEREAFLSGLHMAFAYTAGPCKICKRCPAEFTVNQNEFSKKNCKHPSKTRPSMEACGIDVFKTARKAGFTINAVKEGESFKSFGLLLLD